MKLSELEKAINVVFPEKWYEIYRTGAMEWLELSHGDFNKRRDDYINNPNAFFMLGCDCEPLFFDDVAERIEELNEWISWKCEAKRVELCDNIRLVPFAMMGSGDLYCFLFESGISEPKVILYYHDDFDEPDIIADTFDEFLYVMMLDAAAFDEDIEGERWKAHLKFLSDEYKEKIHGKNVAQLTDEFNSIHYQKAQIFHQ